MGGGSKHRYRDAEPRREYGVTSLTFYGGVNEIGGNKFLILDGGSRVFLDFGKNFARERQYFDEPWLRPGKEDHLIALGILPDLPGIYKKDADQDRSLDAVLISHPHTDHYDSVRWLREDIPVFGTKAAQTMIYAREFSGRPGPSKEYYIANWTEKEGQKVFHPVQVVEPGKPQDAGGLTTTAFEVDHSVLGSAGYIVETSAGNVVYTGDFRLHGPRAAASKAFLEEAAKHDPAALLIEGTHIGESKVESEAEVLNKVISIVAETEGLVLAGFAAADLERLATLYSAAQATDRTLVMTSKQAFLVDQMAAQGLFDGVDLTAKNVRIFRKEKKTSGAYEKYLEERYGDRIVDAVGVKEIQEEAILVASLTDMLALPAIDPVPGSVYILSSSEPYNEEMEISFDKLMGWLTRYGLPLFQIHASGHATAHDLRGAVELVKPKQVYLVHTENPVLYARFLHKLGFKVVPPREGEPYGL